MTIFSLHSDPIGLFGVPTDAASGLESLNAAGFTARVTDEQPRGPYRRYTTGASPEIVEGLPGLVEDSIDVTPDPSAIRPGAMAVLERAYQIAELIIVSGGGSDVDLAQLASCLSTPPERLLAHALVIAGERFERLETTYMCSWCQAAAKGHAEHLALQAYTLAGVREHGPRCDHSPVTKAIRGYFAAKDSGLTAAPAAERTLRELAGIPGAGA